MPFLCSLPSPFPVLPIFSTFFTKAASHYTCFTPCPLHCSLPRLPMHHLSIRATASQRCHLTYRMEMCQRVKKTHYPNPTGVDGCPTARGQYLDKMSIPLSHCCWEKGGYLDAYLDTVPGPISRHPLISLKLVGQLINSKLPSQTLWQLAGKSIFCLTCQITYEKDWIS